MNSSLVLAPLDLQTPRPRTNGNAVASLVLGISSWVIYLGIFCFNLTFGTLLTVAMYGVGLLCLLPLGCVSPIMWLAAVITGHLGMKRAKVESANGRGMALAGLIMGYFGLGMNILVLLAWGGYIR